MPCNKPTRWVTAALPLTSIPSACRLLRDRPERERHHGCLRQFWPHHLHPPPGGSSPVRPLDFRLCQSIPAQDTLYTETTQNIDDTQVYRAPQVLRRPGRASCRPRWSTPSSGRRQRDILVDTYYDNTGQPYRQSVPYDSRGRATQESKTIAGTTFTSQCTYNSADKAATMTYPQRHELRDADLRLLPRRGRKKAC